MKITKDDLYTDNDIITCGAQECNNRATHKLPNGELICDSCRRAIYNTYTLANIYRSNDVRRQVILDTLTERYCV